MFLADGAPTGLIIAEIVNWTGKALVVPRSAFAAFLKRREAQNAGVYILAGPDPNDAFRQIVQRALGNTQPPLNPLELKVVDALARLGIVGQRAQLPFQNASIYAQSGTGPALLVSAWSARTTHGDFTVVDHRQLGGVPVDLVRYPTIQDPAYRFACAQDTYEVNGIPPPTFQDMDAFVSRLIDALGCRT